MGGGRQGSKALRNCQSSLKANGDFTKGVSAVVAHPGIQGNKIVLKTEKKGNLFRQLRRHMRNLSHLSLSWNSLL